MAAVRVSIAAMAGFHRLWIVEAELEATGCEGVGDALSVHACEDTAPYPVQTVRQGDGWTELSFPVWAGSRFAAIAAGAALLAEACARAGADVGGVVRMAAGEGLGELEGYRDRFRAMEDAV